MGLSHPVEFDYRLPFDDKTLSLSSDSEDQYLGERQMDPKPRGQPCSYQSNIEMHAWYSKDVVEERQIQRQRIARLALAKGYRPTNPMDDMIAPEHDSSVHVIKRANLLFLVTDYNTRLPVVQKVAAQTNLVVSDNYNGLSNKVRIIFWGCAAGVSDATDYKSSPSFASHIFGTHTPVNNSHTKIPAGVACFLAGHGHCFRRKSDGLLIPVFAPYDQQHKYKVLPAIFWLKDTDIFSLETRISFQIDLHMQEEERKYPNQYAKAIQGLLVKMADLAAETEPQLSGATRKELMINDFIYLTCASKMLRRCDTWFTYYEDHQSDFNPEAKARILVDVCLVAHKVVQKFYSTNEQISSHFLASVVKDGSKPRPSALENSPQEMFPPGLDLKNAIRRKNWLEEEILSAINICRHEWKSLLQDRWMGTSLKEAAPNCDFDLWVKGGTMVC